MSEETTEHLLGFVRRAFAARIRSMGVTLGPDTPLLSSGLVDSMGLVELLAFAEREFRVSLEATITELTELDTAAKLSGYIQQRRQAQRPARS